MAIKVASNVQLFGKGIYMKKRKISNPTPIKNLLLLAIILSSFLTVNIDNVGFKVKYHSEKELPNSTLRIIKVILFWGNDL